MNTTITSDTPQNIMNTSNLFARGVIIDGKSAERWDVVTALDSPLCWRKSRFAQVMSDPFHPDVPFEFVDRKFANRAEKASAGR